MLIEIRRLLRPWRAEYNVFVDGGYIGDLERDGDGWRAEVTYFGLNYTFHIEGGLRNAGAQLRLHLVNIEDRANAELNENDTEVDILEEEIG